MIKSKYKNMTRDIFRLVKQIWESNSKIRNLECENQNLNKELHMRRPMCLRIL